MTPQRLIGECELAGVFVYVENGAIKMKGGPEAVRNAVDRLRPHKAELLHYLGNHPDRETWGPFTPYCLPVSLATVRELHRLISEYGVRYNLAAEQTQRMIEAAMRQPAASVPQSIAHFAKRIKEKS